LCFGNHNPFIFNFTSCLYCIYLCLGSGRIFCWRQNIRTYHRYGISAFPLRPNYNFKNLHSLMDATNGLGNTAEAIKNPAVQLRGLEVDFRNCANEVQYMRTIEDYSVACFGISRPPIGDFSDYGGKVSSRFSGEVLARIAVDLWSPQQVQSYGSGFGVITVNPKLAKSLNLRLHSMTDIERKVMISLGVNFDDENDITSDMNSESTVKEEGSRAADGNSEPELNAKDKDPSIGLQTPLQSSLSSRMAAGKQAPTIPYSVAKSAAYSVRILEACIEKREKEVATLTTASGLDISRQMKEKLTLGTLTREAVAVVAHFSHQFEDLSYTLGLKHVIPAEDMHPLMLSEVCSAIRQQIMLVEIMRRGVRTGADSGNPLDVQLQLQLSPGCLDQTAAEFVDNNRAKFNLSKIEAAYGILPIGEIVVAIHKATWSRGTAEEATALIAFAKALDLRSDSGDGVTFSPLFEMKGLFDAVRTKRASVNLTAVVEHWASAVREVMDVSLDFRVGNITSNWKFFAEEFLEWSDQHDHSAPNMDEILVWLRNMMKIATYVNERNSKMRAPRHSAVKKARAADDDEDGQFADEDVGGAIVLRTQAQKWLAQSAGAAVANDSRTTVKSARCHGCGVPKSISWIVCFQCGEVGQPALMFACGACNMPQSIYNMDGSIRKGACKFGVLGGCPGLITTSSNVKGADFTAEHYERIKRMVRLHNERMTGKNSTKSPLKPVQRKLNQLDSKK
jgi:hypothetical protein